MVNLIYCNYWQNVEMPLILNIGQKKRIEVSTALDQTVLTRFE